MPGRKAVPDKGMAAFAPISLSLNINLARAADARRWAAKSPWRAAWGCNNFGCGVVFKLLAEVTFDV